VNAKLVTKPLHGRAEATPTKARGRRPRPRLKSALLQALSVALGVGVWFAFAAKSAAFPDPPSVVDRAWQLLTTRTHGGEPILIAAAWASLKRVLFGFAIGTGAAIPVGFLMGWYGWARRLLEPWVQFFRMVPALALIPLVLVLLGIGEPAKIFVIAVSAFLMSVISTYQGVISVERTLIDAARVLGASDGVIFRRVPIHPCGHARRARLVLGNAHRRRADRCTARPRIPDVDGRTLRADRHHSCRNHNHRNPRTGDGPHSACH
jgi:NitT/TauT family transport system permease protein